MRDLNMNVRRQINLQSINFEVYLIERRKNKYFPTKSKSYEQKLYTEYNF